MLSNWHPASSSLTGIVGGIWAVQASSAANLSARVLPDGATCLVFKRDGAELCSCDDSWRPWAAASVSGPRSGPMDIKLGASGRILIVPLLPSGASKALGVPMSTMTDRFEDLDAVIGDISNRLKDCLQGDADELTCIRAIEQWLLERVKKSERIKYEVTDRLVQEVLCRSGSIRVEDLARRLDLSRRHVGRIVRENVGFAPKLFARIVRFDNAVQLGRFSPMSSLAQVALDAGFADQAHMSREFAELGGIRPSDLRGDAAAMIW